MKLCFTPTAWDDYLWFQEHDRKLLKRINLLLQDILRSPCTSPEYWPMLLKRKT